jgi:ATP-dependent Clp protease adaptor protein ClpS
MLKSVDAVHIAVHGPLTKACGPTRRLECSQPKFTAQRFGASRYVLDAWIASSSTLLERQKATQRYPEARVIVLDDDVNTYQHVVDCLRKIIPGMDEDKAWGLARRIDGQGSAEVWRGPLEQAELYHQQLQSEGLTMAPLDRC